MTPSPRGSASPPGGPSAGGSGGPQAAPGAGGSAGSPRASSAVAASSAVVPSPRVQLAEEALGAALSVDGVTGLHPGPLTGARVGAPGGAPLPGVTAIGRTDGRYDLALHLVARPTVFAELADRIRAAVEKAARRAGVADALGRVDVAFADLDVAGPSEGEPA